MKKILGVVSLIGLLMITIIYIVFIVQARSGFSLIQFCILIGAGGLALGLIVRGLFHVVRVKACD